MQKKTLKCSYYKVVLFFIVILALLIRLFGINYDLPYVYNPDEHGFVGFSINMILTGDINPHWFGHPGSFIMYVLAIIGQIEIFICYLFSLMAGNDISYESFLKSFMSNENLMPALFHLTGRIINTIFATVSVIYTFKLGRHLFNRTTGLIASAILALSPLFVLHSKIFRTDIALTMFVIIAVYYALRFFEEPQKVKFLIISGISAGFAVANKYPGLLVMVPLIMVTVYLDIKQYGKLSNVLLANIRLKGSISKIMIFFILALFIAAPYVFLDFATVIINFKTELRVDQAGHEQLPFIQQALWHCKNSLSWGFFSWPMTAMSIIGVCCILIRKEFKNYIFLVYPALIFVWLCFANLRWYRWAIPIYPFQAIATGIAIYYIFQKIKQSHVKLRVTYNIFFVIFMITSLYYWSTDIVKYTWLHSRKNKRTIAKEWIERELPSGTNIAYEGHSGDYKRLNSKKFTYSEVRRVALNPLDYYRKNGIEYLIMGLGNKNAYLTQKDKYKDIIDNYLQIETECELVKTVSDPNYEGSVILIYKVQ